MNFLDEDLAEDRLSSGSNDSKILTRKDVEEMFELPKLGRLLVRYYIGTTV